MTIKVALAGAGAFGIKHLDGIQLIDGVEVVSLIGRELEKTQEVANKYGIAHVTTDLNESLAIKEVDAVILCTPTQMHAAQSIACLQAGKHVQVEIPLCDVYKDGAEVVALQDAASKNLSVEGATVYVSLEPCAHHGKTGPCCEALVTAKVAKVMVAMVDPNPLVAGKGIAQLKACLQPGFYTSLEEKTKALVEGVQSYANQKGYAFNMFQMASIFWISFSENKSIRRMDEISDDGVQWKSVGVVSTKTDEQTPGEFYEAFRLKRVGKSARFVKMTALNHGPCPSWHDAPGEPSWLFGDELIVRTQD